MAPGGGTHDQVLDVGAGDCQCDVGELNRNGGRKGAALAELPRADLIVARSEIADVEPPILVGAEGRTGRATHPVRRPGDEPPRARDRRPGRVEQDAGDARAATLQHADLDGRLDARSDPHGHGRIFVRGRWIERREERVHRGGAGGDVVAHPRFGADQELSVMHPVDAELAEIVRRGRGGVLADPAGKAGSHGQRVDRDAGERRAAGVGDPAGNDSAARHADLDVVQRLSHGNVDDPPRQRLDELRRFVSGSRLDLVAAGPQAADLERAVSPRDADDALKIEPDVAAVD